MKAILIAVKNLRLNHFCRTFSLLSKEMLEKFLMQSHFSPKQRDPQSKNVPSLVDRSHRTNLTRNTASGKPLFLKSSAICARQEKQRRKAANFNKFP
jgi:hypothetical protein